MSRLVRILPDSEAARVLFESGAGDVVGRPMPVVDPEDYMAEYGYSAQMLADIEGSIAVFERGVSPTMDLYGPLPIYDGEYQEVAA